MRDRCFSTVFSLSNSVAAISRWVLPAATSSATSRSRALSAETGAATGPGATRDALSEPSQLARRSVRLPCRAAFPQRVFGLLEVRDAGLPLAYRGERESALHPAAAAQQRIARRFGEPGGFVAHLRGRRLIAVSRKQRGPSTPDSGRALGQVGGACLGVLCLDAIPHSGLIAAIDERGSDRRLLKLLRAGPVRSRVPVWGSSPSGGCCCSSRGKGCLRQRRDRLGSASTSA
jgi:hypothetical protein